MSLLPTDLLSASGSGRWVAGKAESWRDTVEVSGSWCEEKLRALVGRRDGDGQVGGRQTGWKVGEKRPQNRDGRLPD